MKLKAEVVGSVITVVYLALIAVLVYVKRASLPELELNAIGDFLAGVFGPIAFLWLVLGYLQQGRELKLSSEALQLQAVELRNSVDQQKEMVGIAGRQLEAELEKVISEREQKLKALLPNIKMSAYVPSSSGLLNVEISVVNYGSLAENINGYISNDDLFSVPVLGCDQKHVFRCNLPIQDASYEVGLEYEYGNGMKREDKLVMKVAVSNIGSGIAKIHFVPVVTA
jgi:hypothetical protein